MHCEQISPVASKEKGQQPLPKHGYKKEIVSIDRGRVLGWVHDSLSQRYISRQLRVSLSVIQCLLERFKATGDTEERARSGRR